ncbi:MAG: hypothetical protein ACLFNW_04525 [Desulfobacterales bacterium]
MFELAQAMGGGKTHLMAALGLLARHPSRRAEVLPQDVLGRIDDKSARVAVFDGRNSPDHYLWGDIADQLGCWEVMAPFWKHGPRSPSKDDWKNMIGDDSTLLLLDELPPYFLEARTISVGQGTFCRYQSTVDMQDANGCRMRVENAGSVEVIELARLFWSLP